MKLRLLQGEPREMADLQRVLEGAPQYYARVRGTPAGPAEAQTLYTILPEGKGHQDKFIFGVYVDDAMVGCADMIRGWPRPGTAHIGLLLFAEAHQRHGYGRAVYKELEQTMREWRATRARIGVVRTNAEVLTFWAKLGFAATGEVKPHRYGAVTSAVVVLEKAIASP